MVFGHQITGHFPSKVRPIVLIQTASRKAPVIFFFLYGFGLGSNEGFFFADFGFAFGCCDFPSEIGGGMDEKRARRLDFELCRNPFIC